MSIAITVIIPAYNAAQYLAETIDSVLSQSFENFEILVIDDGSTDSTAEIASSYEQLDSRLRVYSQPNQGVSAARNQGILLAQGDLIAFLDADDRWLPDHLQAHVDHFVSSPELGVSFGKVEFMSFDGEAMGMFSNSKLTNLIPEDLYYENLGITPSNVVIRKSVFEQIGGFDANLSGTEDAELFLRAACKNFVVEGIDRVLVRYRITQDGVSSNFEKMERDWNRFNQKVRSYAPALVERHHRRAKAYFLRYLSRRAIRSASPPKVAFDLINRSLYMDWKLLFQEPRRTFLTLLVAYGKVFIDK